MTDKAEWLIFNESYGQFWGPNSGGYFGMWGAGLYTEEDAKRLARNSDRTDRVHHVSEYKDQIANMRGAFERLSAALGAQPPADSAWQAAALLKDRTRQAIRDRCQAGEAMGEVAADYGVPDAYVAALVAWQMAGDARSTPAPKTYCLSGSSRFIDVMAVIAWELEKCGHATMHCNLLPSWYTATPHHLAEEQGVHETLDAVHLRKIDLADALFVIDMNGYIGASTSKEIAYANLHGKPVEYLSLREDLLALLIRIRSGEVGSEGAVPAPPPETWCCFHCAEVFTTEPEAREHFGRSEMSTPGCAITVTEFRQMEQALADIRHETEEMSNDASMYHAQSSELERLFGEGVRSAHQAWLRWEEQESRAMAAEERLAAVPPGAADPFKDEKNLQAAGVPPRVPPGADEAHTPLNQAEALEIHEQFIDRLSNVMIAVFNEFAPPLREDGEGDPEFAARVMAIVRSNVKASVAHVLPPTPQNYVQLPVAPAAPRDAPPLEMLLEKALTFHRVTHIHALIREALALLAGKEPK